MKKYSFFFSYCFLTANVHLMLRTKFKYVLIWFVWLRLFSYSYNSYVLLVSLVLCICRKIFLRCFLMIFYAFLMHFFCISYACLMHFLCTSYAFFMHFLKVHKKYMYFDLKYMHFLCISYALVKST